MAAHRRLTATAMAVGAALVAAVPADAAFPGLSGLVAGLLAPR